MPCPIEIRKTIENSINELLPDQQSVMADSVAKRIVKELNTLWESAISRVVPYSGQGGSFVKINSLDDAVNKEYKRQLEAEKKFERDLDFFKGDEALVEQEQRDLFLQKSPAAIKPDVEGFKEFVAEEQMLQKPSDEGQIASEKTIRDLAARISDRIAIPYKIISDRTQQFKGKIEGKAAVINLAYATLDTPIHEILGHPIIRVLKTGTESNKTLYQNLLKELEYGRGKEVLDRVKRDYKYKENKSNLHTVTKEDHQNGKFLEAEIGEQIGIAATYTLEEQQEEAIVELLGLMTAEKLDAVKDGKLISLLKRLLKEMKQFIRSLINQKEVEIDKLPDNMTIGDLSDLLAYSNSKLILPGYEVEYTTPDNMKFKTYQEASNHISQLAKSVEDVNLAKNISIENIDKEIETLQKELDNFKFEIEPFNKFVDVYTSKGRLRQNYWARKKDGTTGWTGGAKETLLEPEYDGFVLDTDRGDGRFITKISDKEAEKLYYAQENKFNITTKESREKYEELETKIHNLKNNSLKGFIEKNKEYEQSKEIIEEWKRVNNIQYNPEEIYSRGQEFVSIVGAYSDFDVNLMMQNLLQHIEDNQKAGGEFTISAFTKPVDKKIGHLEGGGGKIKFKIYPQSEDIKWAANTDVYSGSVWDASEKVSKDKKSELLGVSYTKYPSLQNVTTVQPNLASIVDNLAHHHNELGIALTGSNFRLEYDEDIPYQFFTFSNNFTTKKIIDGINSILDQKYGKLVKPEIKQKEFGTKYIAKEESAYGDFKTTIFDTEKEALDYKKSMEKYDDVVVRISKQAGIQPTQTKDNLKESIESVKNRANLVESNYDKFNDEYQSYTINNIRYVADLYANRYQKFEPGYSGQLITKEEFEANKPKQKEYTEQALINTKIAKLKEVAKKYPRSLIRSEVVRTREQWSGELSGFEEENWLPFQRIPSQPVIEETLPSNASPKTLKLIKDFLQKIGVDVNVVKEIVVNGVKYDANGVAQIMQQLISVVEGKEAQALPEEAMHFAVAIIKQTNPKLYQKLLKEINGYEMLTQVFRTYGNDPLYQKDGKPDVIKLKEEAIAKVLVEKIINQAEGVLDSSDNLRKVQSWWKDILDWIKDLLYIKSGLDQVTIDIISGKEIGTVEDVSEQRDELFLQKSKQDNFYDTIVETSNRIDKPTDIQKKYVIDGKEVSRVSDVVKTHYDNKQKNRELLKDEYDIALDELRKEKGTAGHADLEHAFSLFIDENGYLRDPQVRKYKRDNDNYSPELGNNVLYDRLVDNLEQRLESYPEGTRFIKEVAIYNGKNLAGTVDFIAITKDGKLDILDWKFMNLNLEYYKDVPWYKIEAWNIQMNEYKKILMDNYGVKPKDFGQTRMIPILAEYSRGRKDKDGSIIELPKLIGIKIGDVNVKNISEEEDFLLPVPTKDEISDNAELDTLIKKLNAAYERFAKEKITPDQKEIKREQLQSLFKAIRRLQIKRDVKPLIEQFKLLKLKTDKFYEKYNNLYKDVDDSVKISEAEMNDFSRESESILNALTTYVDIDLLLKNVVDQDLRNELRDMAYDARENIMKISKIDQDFTSEVIAKREKVNDLLSPEKIIRGLTKAFSSTSTIQVKSIQLLFKKADKALGRATFATQEEGAKLMNIKEKYDEWAKSKGLTSKNFFSFIKKKDSNELIDQYKKEFYKELKKAINNRDVNWIKNNVNIDLLKEEIEEKKNKELEFVNNKPRTGTPEETLKEISKEVSDIERLYNISSDDSKGWFLYDTIKNFPLDKWETQEWKTLNSLENKPAKDFYDYIIEKNKEYADLGYISKQQSRVFLPYVKGSITESLVKGEKISLGEEFWRNISIDDSDVGFGQINPETGKPINTIPKYFTTPFSGTVSEDLFKTMLLYNEAALRYKYLSDIEDQVKAIARVEKNKKSILISTIGDVRRNELGDIQFDPEGGDGNYQLLDSMIKAIIYGQKFVDNQNFDAALLKLGSWGKKINEKLGIKVFPEDMSNRVISLSKSIDSLNRYFTLSTLGLNVGSSLSNLFGGTAQSIINSGKYFTKNDFISSEYQIMTKKFEGLDKEKYLRAFEYFLPITDSYTRDLARQLSVNVVTQESFQDFLMILMKSGDRLVQSANFLAFLENSIVIDNEVVNAREYLRQLPEYKGKYEGSSEDRQKFNQKFEEDVKKLIEEKGVLKLSKVENGKLVIPGVERMSDSVLELRRKVQQLTKDALGNLSDADVRMINLIIIGKSFMVFKNWIPRLVDVRFGGLKYNAGSDAYEWGRIRTLMNYLHEGLVNNHKGLLGLITGNEDGVKLMRDSFEKRAEKYERETGRKLEMDEVLYMDLYQSNLKSAARDMIVLTALAGLTWAIKASIPDDEEDEAVINQFKFAAKLSDKLLDELMYFYNPTSILNLVGSGPFPAMSMVNNSFKGIMNFFKEMFAIVTGDEETQDDIKVLKYVMRSFPFTNQMSGYLPLIYPELAKDLGIRVQTNYGIR